MIFSVIVLPITLSPLPSAEAGYSCMPLSIHAHNSCDVCARTALVSVQLLGPGLFPSFPQLSMAYRDGFTTLRSEALLTLFSSPLQSS